MTKDELTLAMEELDEEKVEELVNQRLEQGISPLEIIRPIQEGMEIVGSKFQSGEYFLSELIMAGEIMKNANEVLEPRLEEGAAEKKGTVVIGTVAGDIHDLGKNIVISLLKGAGYEVVDLGVDVPKEKFVEALKESGAPLVGMSVLLTGCQDAMKEAIDAIREAGLDTKILIGGNFVNEKIKEHVGADYYATHAGDGVDVAKEVVGV